MRAITILGFAAGTLTTIAYVPQVLKAWRTRSCNDLSWGMLVSLTIGILLWLIYGLWLHAPPIIAANGVTLALLLVLVAMKAYLAAR